MTKVIVRDTYQVGHITVATAIDPSGCATFALIAGEAVHKTPKPLFTGIVEKGMGTQLRRLAHHFDDLEKLIDG